MSRLGFAFNPTKPEAIALRDRAIEWCAGAGCNSWAAEAGDTERLTAQLPGTDCVVVLGGDGTFLRAACALALTDVPVLGINSGRVGFLSKVEPEALETTLADVLRGDYETEARMMLEARLVGTGASDSRFVALNDAAIVRGAEVRVMHLEVLVDRTHLATYIADGIVVCTPTGSTAYSFSAGGPILDPTSRNLVVTPVAAYLSSIRSIVVGPAHTVTVRVLGASSAIVSIDGREDHALQVGDAVEIRTLERPLHFIEPRGALPFWELLRQKATILPS